MTRTFDDMIARYSTEVQTLARQTRVRVLELVPGACETIDGTGPYAGYGFGTGYADQVCTILVSKTGVKLGLSGGATLPDPAKLLEGSGKVHKYVVIGTAKDLTRRPLATLVRAALRRRGSRKAPAAPAPSRTR